MDLNVEAFLWWQNLDSLGVKLKQIITYHSKYDNHINFQNVNMKILALHEEKLYSNLPYLTFNWITTCTIPASPHPTQTKTKIHPMAVWLIVCIKLTFLRSDMINLVCCRSSYIFSVIMSHLGCFYEYTKVTELTTLCCSK